MIDRLLYQRFGAAVKARREELKLTQDHIAQKLGLGRSAVVSIEKGEQRILLFQAVELCRVLQLTLDELLAKCTDSQKPGGETELNQMLHGHRHEVVQWITSAVLPEDEEL